MPSSHIKSGLSTQVTISSANRDRITTFFPVAFGSSATRSISAPPPRIASAGIRKHNAAANGDVSCRRPSAANALAGQGRSKKRPDPSTRPPPRGPIKGSTGDLVRTSS
uniref:Uncharacterized protein n=1 Tax=Mesocestoides corti TaxID=53468 RepID=A0A5K3G2R2_MESCO